MKLRFMAVSVMAVLAAVCALGSCAGGRGTEGQDLLGTDLRDIAAEQKHDIAAEQESAGGEASPLRDGSSQDGAGAEDGGLPQDGNTAGGIPPVSCGASDVEAALSCEGELFYRLNFAAGGQQVYVCGTGMEPPAGGSLSDDTYFIGVMSAPQSAQQTCRIRKLDVEFPEDMRVLRMTADSAGNCHLLWVSKAQKSVDGRQMEVFTYERSCIMKINAEGGVESRIDTSELFAENHGLMYCFAADEAGNYYLERGAEILRLDPDGGLRDNIRCSGNVEGIGCGRSGAMYCVCRGEDKEEWLCRIEEDGVTALAALPGADSLYPCMGPGTDTELIFFHKDGGVYAVDVEQAPDAEGGETVTAKLRVPEAAMPVSGQDMGGQGVLADGRVCLYQWKRGESLFYFIPVGK